MPESLFYNEAVPRTVRLQKEWILFRSQSFNSSVFNYCSYPFLVPEVNKLSLLRFEFKNQQDTQVPTFVPLFKLRNKEFIFVYLQVVSF